MSPPQIDLGGAWQASDAAPNLRREFCSPDFVDDAWLPFTVPGHWQSQPHFEDATGPILLRRRFTATAVPNRRHWLCFDGVFSQAAVWLDGSYLGEIEGPFAPQGFDVTGVLASGSEHVVAMDITSPPTAAWSTDIWNPGGVWAPVRLVDTGSVRLSRCKILCTEASPERAVVQFSVELDSATAGTVIVRATMGRATTTMGRATMGQNGQDHVAPQQHQLTQGVAAGQNRLRWTMLVEQPELWWPHRLGDQPLYDVVVEVAHVAHPDEVSDASQHRIGLRHLSAEGWGIAINGEPFFVKGMEFAPVSLMPAVADSSQYRNAVDAARNAGIDVLVLNRHVDRKDLYDAADVAGMLIWQALPDLFTKEKSKRRTSARLARQAIEVLGHHPSVTAWLPDGRRQITTWPPLSDQRRRAIERADPSRVVLELPAPLPVSSAKNLAALLARWPRRGHFITMDLPASELSPAIETLRRLERHPVHGLVVRRPVVRNGSFPEVELAELADLAELAELGESCRPVLLSVELTGPLFSGRMVAAPVYVVNDSAAAIDDGELRAVVEQGGSRLEWSWSGSAPTGACSRVGVVRFKVDPDAEEVSIHLALDSKTADVKRSLTFAVTRTGPVNGKINP